MTMEDPLVQLLRFHGRIRRGLRALDLLADSAEAGELDPLHAHALAEFFAGPVIWHDIDEELSLLPRLRTSDAPPRLMRMLDRCNRAHDTMEDCIEENIPHLWELAKEKTEPDVKRLREMAVKLRDILEPHMRMEELEVFPIARLALSDDEIQQIGREMQSRADDRKHGGIRNALELAVWSSLEKAAEATMIDEAPAEEEPKTEELPGD